jgi:hypothetical protein
MAARAESATTECGSVSASGKRCRPNAGRRLTALGCVGVETTTTRECAFGSAKDCDEAEDRVGGNSEEVEVE